VPPTTTVPTTDPSTDGLLPVAVLRGGGRGPGGGAGLRSNARPRQPASPGALRALGAWAVLAALAVLVLGGSFGWSISMRARKRAYPLMLTH
jgi:hypothetical protein